MRKYELDTAENQAFVRVVGELRDTEHGGWRAGHMLYHRLGRQANRS